MKNKIDAEHHKRLLGVARQTAKLEKQLSKFNRICKKHTSLGEDLLFAAPQYEAMQCMGHQLKFLRDYLKDRTFCPKPDIAPPSLTDAITKSGSADSETLIRFLDSYLGAFFELCGFLESYEDLLKSLPPTTAGIRHNGKAGQKAADGDENEDGNKASAIIGDFIIAIAKSAPSSETVFKEVENLIQQNPSQISGHDFFVLLMLAINSRNRRLLALMLAHKDEIQSLVEIDDKYWKMAKKIYVEVKRSKTVPVKAGSMEGQGGGGGMGSM